MKKPTFYVTTPIYYPNDNLHLGHAYSTTIADVIARYRRLRGVDTWFLTGTDEHGQKLQRKAEAAGKHPKAYIDGIVTGIQNLWSRLEISYDDFIRTTEPRHEKIVQQIFSKLLEQGDIYLSEYEGLYCTPCESFWLERQLQNGCCPECGGPVELVREESYFFRMQKYAERLIAYYEEHPDFILPESRRNEMLNNFLRPGLEDLCVSRTTFDWGIPVRENAKHVIYVWLDALTNYITAAGYLSADPQERAHFERYWPADVHVMGKEIVRFHAIYWPIILMALDLPLPKRILAHGWLLMKDGKMSKSKGNVVDPNVLIDRYGSDALRYFLLREIPLGQDGVFTFEGMVERLNFDLANDLGNLLHRTLSMLERFAGGRVPEPGAREEAEQAFEELILQSVQDAAEAIERYEFSTALAAIWRIVREGNRYIDRMAPWTLNKTGNVERLGTVLYTTLDTLRIVGILLQPFMPKAAPEIFRQLGLAEGEATTWDAAARFRVLPSGGAVAKGEPIFPRLDVEKEMEGLGRVLGWTAHPEEARGQEQGAHEQNESSLDGGGPDEESYIDIEDFSKVDLRVAKVLAAEKVEHTDKLLRLELDLGSERRQVVSGISKRYQPEELIGQTVILVANLRPVKLRGILSQGMILAASLGERLTLVTVASDIAAGAKVK